jgi:hypothetical protein
LLVPGSVISAAVGKGVFREAHHATANSTPQAFQLAVSSLSGTFQPEVGKQFKGASRTRNTPAAGLAGNGTATSPAWGGVSSGFGGARGRSGVGGPSRLGMLADICMVLVWGGSIPAVMWLGSAVGL